MNPLAIVFERKIWPPSVLPLPMVGFVAAWYFRRTIFGSFMWGLLGTTMAQVHLSAGFLAVAVAVAAWTASRDRGQARWGAWLAGSVLGAVPALPWLFHMERGLDRVHPPDAGDPRRVRPDVGHHLSGALIQAAG